MNTCDLHTSTRGESTPFLGRPILENPSVVAPVVVSACFWQRSVGIVGDACHVWPLVRLAIPIVWNSFLKLLMSDSCLGTCSDAATEADAALPNCVFNFIVGVSVNLCQRFNGEGDMALFEFGC